MPSSYMTSISYGWLTNDKDGLLSVTNYWCKPLDVSVDHFHAVFWEVG